MGPRLDAVEVIKSPNDHKSYRYFVLPNEMQVLLVSDSTLDHTASGDVQMATTESEAGDEREGEADDDGDDENEDDDEDEDEGDGPVGRDPHEAPVKRAAASMTVAAGSFADPLDMQGLSHYLEHMLFMGSKGFPDENEFSEFLVKMSGTRNAYTEAEHTNYHLDVHPAGLYGALQRFAGFFTDPLCKEESLQKEVNAVDSEFTGVRQNDTCRQFEMMAHTAREGHPLHKFMWGNRRSLWDEPRAAGIDVRARIMQHYAQHYSASRMCLAVLGGQDLDTLQRWVEELYSQVPNSGIPRQSIRGAGPPFQGRRLYLAPAVQEGHTLIVTFQLPSLLEQYGRKADEYVAHLVGHEGPGSLLSALRKRGWATEVSAGVEASGQCRNSGYFLFQVGIVLTQEGLEAGPGMGLATVGLVFEYLAMLRARGPQEWVWAEMKGISEMAFRFEEDDDALHVVTHLAEGMLAYAPRDVLVGHYLFSEWDPALVQRLVDLMTPEQDGVRVDLMTSDFGQLEALFMALPGATRGREPWFEMEYLAAPLSDALVEAWRAAPPSPDLALPPPNPYVATDFSLLPGAPPNEVPEARGPGMFLHREPRFLPNGAPLPSGALLPPDCLVDVPGFRLFHKLVTAHGTPRADALFRLSSAAFAASPAAYAKTKLMVECLSDALTEESYLADMANLSSNIAHSGVLGIELTVSGFSHRLPVFTSRVFEALTTVKANPETFAAVKEELLRRLRNQHLDVSAHADYLRLRVLIEGKFDADDVLAALEGLTPADVEAHRAEALRDAHLEALIAGNVSAAAACELGRSLHRALGTGLQQVPDTRQRQHTFELQPGFTYHLSAPAKNADEKNSVVQCYHQLGVSSPREHALQVMIEQILQEQIFDVLRTKEQLGYSVRCVTHNTNQVLGFNVVVVSDKDPAFVESRIDSYMQSAASYLDKELTDEDFRQHVRSAVTLKMEPCKSLREQVDRHWGHIWYEDYWFTERYAMLAELQQLSREDVASYFKTKLCPSGPERRKLCVTVVAHQHAKPAAHKPLGTPAGAHHVPPPHGSRVVEIVDISLSQKSWSLLHGHHTAPPPPVNRPDATTTGLVA